MPRDAGKRIRQARKEFRMNQTQLARKVGVSLTTISDWETGKTSPSLEHLATLSKVLHKDPAWFIPELLGEEAAVSGREVGGARGKSLSIVEIERLIEVLKSARRMASRFLDRRVPVRGAGEPDESASPGVLNATVLRLPRFENPELPVSGMAAADTREGREWTAEAAEPGEAARADAEDPRLVCVRGRSAEEFARDGQHVVIDAASTNVSVGDVCIVLTKDGILRLKRKLPDDGKNRRYESINPAYPPLVVPARDVVAEFPVCAVLTKVRTVSPVETQDEGSPPAQ